MFYAIEPSGNRIEPFPKGKATCPCCNSSVIAKCGGVKVWHWAHSKMVECDSWYEPMTLWHRKWQNNFHKDFQEVIMHDEVTGEKHIADICLPNKIVFEFQHSKITSYEFLQRQNFYEKLIWVIDAENFFPDADLFQQISYYKISVPNIWQWLDDVIFHFKKDVISFCNDTLKCLLVYDESEKRYPAFRYYTNSENEENKNLIIEHISNLTTQFVDNYGLHLSYVYGNYKYTETKFMRELVCVQNNQEDIKKLALDTNNYRLIPKRDREIYDLFKNAHVFIDNLPDYKNYLFDYNNLDS